MDCECHATNVGGWGFESLRSRQKKREFQMLEAILQKAQQGHRLEKAELKVLMNHMLAVLQNVLQMNQQARRNAGLAD